MKVLITGGTGLIGSNLQEILLAKGIQVLIMSRTERKSDREGLSFAVWNVEKGELDTEAVCSVDHIIHLAGANVAEKRWSTKQKQRIIDSRVKTAALLFKTLKENNHQVKSFISASGISYYGTVTTSKTFEESDGLGEDFLAKVCDVWEKAALQFSSLGIRTVCLRTGVVFAKEGSALQKMAQPIKMGIGAPVGSGKQIMPIIHIDDMVNMYVAAVKSHHWDGIYNAVAVNDTNKKVTARIAAVLNKSLWFPNVPAFMLKLIFGEMAIILLEGSPISNKKAKEIGFTFRYNTLEEILDTTF